MKRRASVLYCLPLAAAVVSMAQTPPAAATEPDPEITFFTGHFTVDLRPMLPADKHDMFRGTIYDVDKAMVHLSWPAFITLTLPPGVHTFSASRSSKHPDDKSQTTMLLEPGHHYYVRVETAHHWFEDIPIPVPPMGGVVPIPRPGAGPYNVLSVEDCAAAQREAGNKQWEMKQKYVEPAYQAGIVPGVPQCPPAASATPPTK